MQVKGSAKHDIILKGILHGTVCSGKNFLTTFGNTVRIILVMEYIFYEMGLQNVE